MSIGKMMINNFLYTSNFKFKISRLPNVEFFAQSATVPGISMGVTSSPTPFKTIRFSGDKLEYETFSVTMIIDEYMNSYNEIYDWMVGLTKPESFKQYDSLSKSEHGLYSDASLIIFNSRGLPSMEVHYKDVFPISLGSISFDTTQTDVQYAKCDVTFEHNGHVVTRI